jgi:hypothetical protein
MEMINRPCLTTKRKVNLFFFIAASLSWDILAWSGLVWLSLICTLRPRIELLISSQRLLQSLEQCERRESMETSSYIDFNGRPLQEKVCILLSVF